MQTLKITIQQGFEQFLNIFLFSQSDLPELRSDNFYQLGDLALNTSVENYQICDKNGMGHFENVMTLMQDDDFIKVRENILSLYHKSPAKNIINELMQAQNKAYWSQYNVSELDDNDLKFAFLKTQCMPLQIKAFLTNHFADIFTFLYIVDGKISKECYDNLLLKYGQPKEISEITSNMETGIHNPANICVYDDESTRLNMEEFKRYCTSRIKLRKKLL